MKKALFAISLCVAVCAGAASGAEELPESCQPKVGDALALADEAEAAQLQCDLDIAEQLGDESVRLFNTQLDPAIRVVDTLAPSGSAYVYDIVDQSGALMLDVRTVPMAENTGMGPCRLRVDLSEPVGEDIARLVREIVIAAPPAYGKREEVVINADGSRAVKLLLDTHDIITTIGTDQGTFGYSRHAKANGPVNDLNQRIFGIANASNGWQCVTR